jgi:chromosome partitioning protein
VSKVIVETVQKEHKEKVFQTVIRQNVKITEASTLSQDIFTYDKDSPAADDYMNLAKELLA